MELIKKGIYIYFYTVLISCASTKKNTKVEINHKLNPPLVGVYSIQKGDILYQERTLRQVFDYTDTESDFPDKTVDNKNTDNLFPSKFGEAGKTLSSFLDKQPTLIDEQELSSRKLIYLDTTAEGTRILYREKLLDGRINEKIYKCPECVNNNGFLFDIKDIKIQFFSHKNDSFTYSIVSSSLIANSRAYSINIIYKNKLDYDWKNFWIVKSKKSKFKPLTYYKDTVIEDFEKTGMIYNSYPYGLVDGVIRFNWKVNRPQPRSPLTHDFNNFYTYYFNFTGFNVNKNKQISESPSWVLGSKIKVANADSRLVLNDIMPLLVDVLKQKKTQKILGKYNACNKKFVEGEIYPQLINFGEAGLCTDKVNNKEQYLQIQSKFLNKK